eukprot:symbB.v1.2.003638.t1/scaffold203.1/size271217/30
MQPVVYRGLQGLEVKGRRRLQEVAFEDILGDLQGQLTEQLNQAEESVPVIQDLDLSQNKLTLEHFESLFVSLGVASARVVRFRLFGCPTLDDQAMQLMAEYFRSDLIPETAPSEMHLSDCAITADGFYHLMSAIEESNLYPRPDERVPNQGWPLYLRLENNYISREAIQEKIDSGLIQVFTKQDGAKRVSLDGPKVNLLAQGSDFRQREGLPPDPEAFFKTVKQLNDSSKRLKAVLKGFKTVKFLWLLVHQLLLRRCNIGSQRGPLDEDRYRLPRGEPKKMEQSETELKSVSWYHLDGNVDTKVETGVLL